jgi:predicted acyltransferase
MANKQLLKANAEIGPRLVSLDALRGFDMFWIIGADSLFKALDRVAGTGLLRVIANQLDHKDWEGFAFYDLIFPLFVFMVGMSLVFSLDRSVTKGGKTGAVLRIARRAVLLYLIGIFYYGGLSGHLADIRLLGVLQRISLCYFFAGIMYVYLKPGAIFAVFAAILGGYWALMALVPVPGVGVGTHSYAEGANLANYLDKMYLPWKKYDGDHDPEGMLSTLPAVASCLLGVFAAIWLKRKNLAEWKKAAGLAVSGVLLLLLGFCWGHSFPVIKKIWTSSYVLVAGGWSLLLMALFYLVVDIWKLRIWAAPFIWIGMNAITLYLLCNLADLDGIARRFVGGDVGRALGEYSLLVSTATVLGINVLIAGFLYRRKIFLRL